MIANLRQQQVCDKQTRRLSVRNNNCVMPLSERGSKSSNGSDEPER